MDGEALDALELPAILERLAAAAATDLGAELARALVPSADADEVGARQALTAEAVVLLDGADDPPLAGVTDIAGFVERAERDGVLSPADLRAVSVSARVAVDARRVVHGRRDAVPLLAAIAERIEPSLVRPRGRDRPLRRGRRLRPARRRVAEAAQVAPRAAERRRAPARRARADRADRRCARRASGVVPRRAGRTPGACGARVVARSGAGDRPRRVGIGPDGVHRAAGGRRAREQARRSSGGGARGGGADPA